jgi:hypothetical protein
MVFRRFALKSALIVGGLIFAATAVPRAAEARVFVGVGIGVPYYYPPPAYYYGPPAVVYAPPPVVYAPPPAYEPPVTYMSQPQQYWYYCDDPRGYYPNVGACPQGWRAVPATSSPAQK